MTMKNTVTTLAFKYLEKCLGKIVQKKGKRGVVASLDEEYGILTIQFADSVMKVKFPDAFENGDLQFEDTDTDIEEIIRQNNHSSAEVPKQTYEELIEFYKTRFDYKKPLELISNKGAVTEARPAIKTVTPGQCNTCKLLKNGECGGLGGECDDYEPLVVSTTHDPSLYRKKRGSTKYIKTGQSEYDDIGAESIYNDFSVNHLKHY